MNEALYVKVSVSETYARRTQKQKSGQPRGEQHRGGVGPRGGGMIPRRGKSHTSPPGGDLIKILAFPLGPRWDKLEAIKGQVGAKLRPI